MVIIKHEQEHHAPNWNLPLALSGCRWELDSHSFVFRMYIFTKSSSLFSTRINLNFFPCITN